MKNPLNIGFNNKESWRRLETLRKQHNLTQEELCRDILNISDDKYRKWKSDIGSMDAYSLKKLCLLYNVSSDYIIIPSEWTHVENEEISELTGLSDESIEVLRDTLETGDNRYIFMLDLLLSDRETFSSLMDSLCHLLSPNYFGFDLDHIPKQLLSDDGRFLILKPENIRQISEDVPENVYQRIKRVIEEFREKNQDKRIIAPNEYRERRNVMYEIMKEEEGGTNNG